MKYEELLEEAEMNQKEFNSKLQALEKKFQRELAAERKKN